MLRLAMSMKRRTKSESGSKQTAPIRRGRKPNDALTPKSYDKNTRLTDLQAFLDVAKAKVQADSGLLRGRSQADVSRRCKRAESLFPGVALFERTPSGLKELSSAGKEVAEHIQQFLGFVDEVRARPSGAPLVRLGFSPVLRPVITEALLKIEDAIAMMPSSFQIREATADVVLDLIAQRQLDLSIGFDLGIDADVQKRRIGDQVLLSQPLELVLPKVVAARYPKTIAAALQNLRRCFIKRAASQPAEPLASYPLVSKWLTDRHKVRVDPSSEVACGTAGELFSLCATGKFYGLLPPIDAQAGGPDVQFVVAEGLRCKIDVHAYFRKELDAKLQQVLPELKKACARLDRAHTPVHLHDLPQLLRASQRR